jgi:hypothetical protein
MSNERKPKSDDNEAVFSSSDLKYILDVNQKAVEIYVEVEKQNDQILKILNDFKETVNRIEEELGLLKQSELNVEELLRDDNDHDHSVMAEMIKTLSGNIQTLTDEVRDIQTTVYTNKTIIDEIKTKIAEIDKNLFRLVIILGSAGIGTIFTVLQTFLPHK